MIRHVFKMIWNRKKRNFLLMAEIFLAFLVMFALASTVITGVSRYLNPLGFSYEDVWVLHVQRSSWEDPIPDSLARARMTALRRELEAMPEVKKLSFISSNYPYSGSRWSTGFKWDGTNYSAAYWRADDNFAEVMGLTLLEGRWFNSEDDASTRKTIVVNRQMRDELFPDESPVGKIQIDDDGDERKIVGVVENYRYRGEFESHRSGFFERHALSDTTASISYWAVFSVQPGSDARVEERILKGVQPLAQDQTFLIETLSDVRSTYMRQNLLSTAMFATVAGFMIFNVALGLFGVLWQSISRRRSEVGLRRAMGATRGHIGRQILAEALVMATFAVVAGVLVGAQIPLLGLSSTITASDTVISDSIYVLGMACAALLTYLIVSMCALYPSQLAARVQPATALHDD